jgi:hypothetical protein
MLWIEFRERSFVPHICFENYHTACGKKFRIFLNVFQMREKAIMLKVSVYCLDLLSFSV